MADPITWQPPTLPDVQGGTHAPAPETYRNAVLRAHGTAMAHEATRLFYTIWPDLQARYGERGRQHTYEDNYWHFSTMDTAIAHDSPSMWLQYVEWLTSFLRSRGMADELAAANFVFFRRHVAALSLDAALEPERAAVLRYLDMAVSAFPEALRHPPTGA